ncbi:MAG: M14-type cytosolic carboxypeptidase, partial [Candidatus Hinthialibacter sp.]
GSLGEWSVNANHEIVLTHAPEAGGLWYYFRIDGAAGKSLTFVFENARKDFFGGDSLPAVSYDQKNWAWIKRRFIQPHPADLNLVRYSFTHVFAADRAWLAFSPPYGNQQLDALVEEIKDHPHVTIQTLCSTPLENLPIPIMTITDPEMPNNEKRCVFVLAREEALESASSWLCEGLIQFLLSEDPAPAALRRRCIFLFVPILDRDGVALGTAVHPLDRKGKTVYWTEAWPETSYSFYEQRQLKRFLQTWKDGGKKIDYSLRIHSSAWNQDALRREHCAESRLEDQERFFGEILSQTYLPWYNNQERVLQDTRFSKFAADLFPDVITGLCLSEYRFHDAFSLDYPLYKTVDDLKSEGRLFVYALAEILGVPASNPPPFLHAAEMYEMIGAAGKKFHVRCVYRDLLNRPPEYVRVLVDEQAVDLKPVMAPDRELDYQTGVLYTGYVSSPEKTASHTFAASNGSRTVTLPQTGSRIGPLLFAPASIR